MSDFETRVNALLVEFSVVADKQEQAIVIAAALSFGARLIETGPQPYPAPLLDLLDSIADINHGFQCAYDRHYATTRES